MHSRGLDTIESSSTAHRFRHILTLRAIACWFSVLSIGLTSAVLQASEPTRPNVVLVMADDQGWGKRAITDIRS